jgi:hypothetical protein
MFRQRFHRILGDRRPEDPVPPYVLANRQRQASSGKFNDARYDAGFKIAGFVKDIVCGEQTLAVSRFNGAIPDEKGLIMERHAGIAGIFAYGAQNKGDAGVVCGADDAVQGFFSFFAKRRIKQQISGRIADKGEFRRNADIRPLRRGKAKAADEIVGVGFDISHNSVALEKRYPHIAEKPFSLFCFSWIFLTNRPAACQTKRFCPHRPKQVAFS